MAVKCSEAWLYWDRNEEPTKGYVVYNGMGFDDTGYFIKDGMDIMHGYVVSDEEGMVDEAGYVWFAHRVPKVELNEVYRRYYERKLEEAKNHITYYEQVLKEIEED